MSSCVEQERKQLTEMKEKQDVLVAANSQREQLFEEAQCRVEALKLELDKKAKAAYKCNIR